MLTVINNTTMQPIATVDDMNLAVTWAETIPYQNDFSIIAHCKRDLETYSVKQLKTLYNSLHSTASIVNTVTHKSLIERIIFVLNERVLTSAMPPDEKRVAPLSNEDYDMTKKTTTKTAVKKDAPKKVAAKKAEPKVERVMQNGILLPKTGSKAGQCWVIADKLAKKAGSPPKRSDVVEACVKAGLNKAGSSADFQTWRKFHGLVNKES